MSLFQAAFWLFKIFCSLTYDILTFSLSVLVIKCLSGFCVCSLEVIIIPVPKLCQAENMFILCLVRLTVIKVKVTDFFGQNSLKTASEIISKGKTIKSNDFKFFDLN